MCTQTLYLCYKNIGRIDHAFGHDNGVKSCIITVPSHYKLIPRQIAINAAQLAGIEVVAIVNEPISPAMNLICDVVIKINELGEQHIVIHIMNCDM